MRGIDPQKLDGLAELIKLLLALTQPAQHVNPPPPAAPAPPPPPGGAAGTLLGAAEVVERSSEAAVESVRNGLENARSALVQLAQVRDEEQRAVERVIAALTDLKSIQPNPAAAPAPAVVGIPAAPSPAPRKR